MTEKKRILDRVLQFMGIEEAAAFQEEVKPRRASRRAQVAEPVSAGVEVERPSGVPVRPLNGELSPDRRTKVVVMRPRSFEDVQAVADHLKGGEPVVLSLEHVGRELSKRIVDFVSGATYALDGHIQRLNEDIFLVAPDGVEIDGRLRLPSGEEDSIVTP